MATQTDDRYRLDNSNNDYTNKVLNVWAETVLTIINPTNQVGRKSLYITFVDYMLINYHNTNSKCVDLWHIAQKLNTFKDYIFSLNAISINVRLVAEICELTATQFNDRVEKQRELWANSQTDGIDCMNSIKSYDKLIKEMDSPF